MICTEIIGLIEMVRTLISRKAELDKQYYEQFIQPTWEAFVKVHEDYKNSFREYANSVSKEDFQVKTLVEQIQQDSVYTSDLRTELRKLIKNLPSAHMKTKQAYLSDFAEALIEYFGFEDALLMSVTFTNLMLMAAENPLRHAAASSLVQKGEDWDRVRTKVIFDQLTSILQCRYDKVAETYYRLRKELLT